MSFASLDAVEQLTKSQSGLAWLTIPTALIVYVLLLLLTLTQSRHTKTGYGNYDFQIRRKRKGNTSSGAKDLHTTILYRNLQRYKPAMILDNGIIIDLENASAEEIARHVINGDVTIKQLETTQIHTSMPNQSASPRSIVEQDTTKRIKRSTKKQKPKIP